MIRLCHQFVMKPNMEYKPLKKSTTWQQNAVQVPHVTNILVNGEQKESLRPDFEAHNGNCCTMCYLWFVVSNLVSI
jgi:hypothetical protein